MASISQSLRRAGIAAAVTLVAAVAAAGPAGATTTWDPNCPSGCTLAAVSDGTSNTLQVGEAVHRSVPQGIS
jgi:hypothetical protein